jgi:very-short-patch-repair endonuclease
VDGNKGKTEDPLSLWERDRESNKLLRYAKTMRTQASDAELLLWRHLRARRLHGYKFRRQVVIEPYIVDFVCIEAKLVVEADGGQHAEQIDYDEKRSARLKSVGYRVMRFWNHQILMEPQMVLEQIHKVLLEAPSPQPFT